MLQFLPKRDYTIRYVRVFAVAIPSVCRLSSVTLVHPTQGVEPFLKISSPLCTLTSVQNFTEIVPGAWLGPPDYP